MCLINPIYSTLDFSTPEARPYPIAWCPVEDRYPRKKDVRGGGGYAELMSNSFWLFSIKPLLAPSYPRQDAVRDTSYMPGALLKIQLPAMVLELTHNNRVLPEQASLMPCNWVSCGFLCAGYTESRTANVLPPHLYSQTILSPFRSVRKYKHHWGKFKEGKNLNSSISGFTCPHIYKPFWICTAPMGSARLGQWVINKCKSMKPENSCLTLMSTLTRVQKTVGAFLSVHVASSWKHTHTPYLFDSRQQCWAMSGNLNSLVILSCQTIWQSFPGCPSS